MGDLARHGDRAGFAGCYREYLSGAGRAAWLHARHAAGRGGDAGHCPVLSLHDGLLSLFAGGAYAFVKETYGYDRSFLVAWFLALTYLNVLWANVTSIPLFARFFLGRVFCVGYLYTVFGYDVYLGEALLSVVALVLTCLLCSTTRRWTARLNFILACCFFVGIVLCFAVSFFKLDRPLSPAYVPGKNELSQIIRIAVISPWAFIGFESISHGAEEMRFSMHKVFRILTISVIATTLLYIFIFLLSVTAFPPEYADWLAYIRDLGNLTGLDGLPAFYAARHYMGSYGKERADAILCGLALRLRELARRYRGILCRREADTFLVYCTHRNNHQEIFNLLHDSLADREGESIPVHLRMGVYENVDKTLDVERRFDRAQSAANLMRGTLTHSVSYYDSALHEKELFAALLVDEFHTAIRERQFVVYYQPKFDIRHEEPILVGAEALVRWKHPRLGLVRPGVYVPIFEENGLIKELDRYVWMAVAEQIQDWKKRFGFCLSVSVNVSRVDIFDSAIMDTFRTILTKYHLHVGELQLEITESVYTQDSAQIISTVNLLRDLGFCIEMDDFGTGYSSLNMISTLPLDALKLDMKFIRDAFRDGRDTRLIEVIIEIADYLKVPIIAEGVETQEQLDTLKALGCHQVQGYYFSRPVPACEYEPFLLARLQQNGSLKAQLPGFEHSAEKETPLPRESDSLVPALQWLSEQIPNAFLAYQADGIQQILFVNQELLHLYGCKTREELGEFTGNCLKGFVHPEDYSVVREAIEQTGGEPENANLNYVEFRILSREGICHQVEAYGISVNLPEYGKISCVFLGDINERGLTYRGGDKAPESEFFAATACDSKHPDGLSETERNLEQIITALQEKILTLQFEMVLYIKGDRCGLVLYNSQSGSPSLNLPDQAEGSYDAYLQNCVLPLASTNVHSREAIEETLSLSNVLERLDKSNSYVFELTCEAKGETFLKQFSYYALDPQKDFYLLLISDVPDQLG